MAKAAWWFKIQSNRLIQPFQVRDVAGRTLLGRARWLGWLSVLVIVVGVLLTNRGLNLWFNRDLLEQTENNFIGSFYPAYDSLYYWLRYQGNLAEQLDKRLAKGDTAADFVADLSPTLEQLPALKYIQFGTVGVNGQWRATPQEGEWTLTSEVNQDFAAWLLTQELQSDRIYWAQTRLSQDEIGLFWFYPNEDGDKVYFLAAVDFQYPVAGGLTTERLGAVVFLGEDGGEQAYTLQPIVPVEATEPATATERASLRRGQMPAKWPVGMLVVPDNDQTLPRIEQLTLLGRKFWVKYVPVVTQTDYRVMAVLVESQGPWDRLGLTLPILRWTVVAFLVLNVIIFLLYYWQFSRRYYFTNQVRDIIKGGENGRLEFKSSLRYDLKEKTCNRELEHTVMKSLAAFNNTDGGLLVIGISDTGEILGLRDDYGTLKKADKDGFELHLRSLISQAYGEHFAARRIDIFFPMIDGQEICLVKIKKGRTPLYTTITDKNGAKQERFYIRMGNSSREIEKPSDIVDYQNQRFKRRVKFGKK